MLSFEHALNTLQLNQTWCPYFEKYFSNFWLRELVLEKFPNFFSQTVSYIDYLQFKSITFEDALNYFLEG